MLIYSGIDEMRDALEACRNKISEPIFKILRFYPFKGRCNYFDNFSCQEEVIEITIPPSGGIE